MKAMGFKTMLSVICGLFLYMALLAPAAEAAYPEGPITVLVSHDPGSTSDLIARTVAIGAEKALGVRLIIENKGGGGGTVAMATLAGAKPDGYTVCVAPSDVVVHNALMMKVPYKPLKSFTPILGMSFAGNTALIVNKDAPWQNFQEFIADAKKNPGKIKYSSAGVGTAMHAAMEFVGKQEGIQWTHIPHKGASQARIAMMGGHVEACSAGAEFAPFALDGIVRVLATHGAQRSPQFPGVPTLKELGYDFVKETIHSLFGPADLPPAILQKLEAAFSAGTQTLEFKDLLGKIDCTPANYDSKQLDRFTKDLWGKTETMFKEAGIIQESATQPY